MSNPKRGSQIITGHVSQRYYAPLGELGTVGIIGKAAFLIKAVSNPANRPPNHFQLSLINSLLDQYANAIQFAQRGWNDMARKTNNFGGYSFVEWRPNRDEKDLINHELANGFNILMELEDTVAQGYKLSLSYHVESDSFIASLSCKEPSDSNYKRVLSLWHKDGQKAVGAVLVAHRVILGTDWPTDGQSRTEHDW